MLNWILNILLFEKKAILVYSGLVFFCALKWSLVNCHVIMKQIWLLRHFKLMKIQECILLYIFCFIIIKKNLMWAINLCYHSHLMKLQKSEQGLNLVHVSLSQTRMCLFHTNVHTCLFNKHNFIPRIHGFLSRTRKNIWQQAIDNERGGAFHS